MIEQNAGVAVTTEAPTGTEDQTYAGLLKGQGTEPNQASPISEPEVTNDPNHPEANALPDPEIVLGEERKAKLSEIIEWEKGYLRQQDYTKKTQAISEIRKSFEGAFGQLPEPQDIKALGHIWKTYHANPQFKQVLDAVFSGQDFTKVIGQAPSAEKPNPNGLPPEVQAHIQKLESKIDQLTHGFESRQEAEVNQRAKEEWESWVEKQTKSNVQITEEIDKSMVPFVDALSKAYPDWDTNKILDAAYRHATIGEVEKKIVSQTLQEADKAKIRQPPKITPKTGNKPESDMSYGDILRAGAK